MESWGVFGGLSACFLFFFVCLFALNTKTGCNNRRLSKHLIYKTLLVIIYQMGKCIISFGRCLVPSYSSCCAHGESLNLLWVSEGRDQPGRAGSSGGDGLDGRHVWKLLECFFQGRCSSQTPLCPSEFKTKTFGVNGSQLEHISYLLSLVLRARFTFSWVCPLACSSGNLSPTPPPDLDSESNKACWVVALDK